MPGGREDRAGAAHVAGVVQGARSGEGYRALVHGAPPDRLELDTAYGRHPVQRKRFSSKVREGKRAVTRFSVLSRTWRRRVPRRRALHRAHAPDPRPSRRPWLAAVLRRPLRRDPARGPRRCRAGPAGGGGARAAGIARAAPRVPASRHRRGGGLHRAAPSGSPGGAAGAGVILAGVRLDDHVPAVLDRARALLRLPGGPRRSWRGTRFAPRRAPSSSFTKAWSATGCWRRPRPTPAPASAPICSGGGHRRTQDAGGAPAVPVPAAPRILDVGSGPGAAALAALDLLGGEAVCFDVSEPALAEAQRPRNRAGPCASFRASRST